VKQPHLDAPFPYDSIEQLHPLDATWEEEACGARDKRDGLHKPERADVADTLPFSQLRDDESCGLDEAAVGVPIYLSLNGHCSHVAVEVPDLKTGEALCHVFPKNSREFWRQTVSFNT
jgi:hypothetical protein